MQPRKRQPCRSFGEPRQSAAPRSHRAGAAATGRWTASATTARPVPPPASWPHARCLLSTPLHCREAGARVARHVKPADMNLDVPAHERRIEVAANGLPL